MNDTVISNPQMTVPLHISNVPAIIPSSANEYIDLCYEVHGRRDTYFNLVSDDCVCVNAHFAEVHQGEDINIIDKIGIRAVDSEGVCRNIEVGINGQQCTTTIDGATVNDTFVMNDITIRIRNPNRVRISVPNCQSRASLVMWVSCEKQEFFSRTRANADGSAVVFEGFAIRFVITRGLNLRDTSHGILGKSHYWYCNLIFTVPKPVY